MKRSTRVATALITIVAATALVACGSADTKSGPSGDSKIVVANFANNALSLPFYIAQEEGFFKDNHVDPEFVGVESGPAAASLVAGGSADIGQFGADTLLSLIEKGGDFKVLAGYQKSDLSIIASLKVVGTAAGEEFPAGLKTLKGKTIGVPVLGSLAERYARMLLKEEGMDPDKDVSFLAVGAAPTATAAMQEGKIDANASALSINNQLLASGIDAAVVSSATEDTAGEFGNSVIFNVPATLAATATKKKEELGRYCSAITAANGWIRDDKNQSALAGYAATWMKLDEQWAARAAEVLPTLVGDEVTEDVWNRQLSILPEFKTPYSSVTFGPCA